MRTFGHILLGMLLGIILLVVAIGGAVYGLISVPVGDLQNTFNLQILPQDNPLFTQSLLQIIQSAVDDIQNMNTLPVRTVLTKYGIKLPDDIKPVIEPLMDVKVGDLINDPNKALNDVVDKVTLNSIVDIANIDKASLTKYPIMAENMDKNVATAMKSFTDLLDANTLTIRGLKDNLGFTLGEMELLDEVQDLPINSFADAIQTIEIGTVLGVDTDKFIPNKDVQVFAKVDKFERVSTEANPYAVTYLAGIQDGKQIRKELHFVLKDKPTTEAQTTADVISQNKDDYKVDNGESTAENPKVFYRFIEYEPYDATKHIDKDLYVGTIINSFVASGTTYVPKDSVKLSAKNLFIEDTVTLEAQIKNSTIAVVDGKIAKLEDIKYSVYDEATKVTSYIQAPHYGFVEPATADTVLETNIDGFLRVYAGTSDMAIQHLSGLTINELSQNPTDKIMTLKLSDVLKDIKEDNPLYSLKDCMLKDIPDEIKTLKVGDVITDIKVGAYTENPDGDYVFVDGIYTFYNKDKHDSSLKHYDYHEEYCIATQAEINDTAKQKFIVQADKIVSQTQDQVNANLAQTYYVVGTASSRLLQRMATTDLNSITTLIDTIALGDVMPIDKDNMLYALAGCTIKEIPDKINTLTIDEVLKDIKIGAYTPNPNGAYYFNEHDNCYQLYTPTLGAVARFDYHNDYYVASKAEIKNATINKFVWNKDKFDFIEQTDVIANPDQQYFINAEASSKILQRLAKTSLNNLGSLMDSLVLGDVMYLDLDTYVLYSESSELPGNFYYFEDNIYKRAFKQEDKSFTDKKGNKLVDKPIYQIEKEGSSHAIIKKLANISINNMGNAFTTLMDELYFTDIITDINANAVVKENATATTKGYIVEEYELTPGLTYVFDNNGMYYQSGIKYVPIADDIRAIPTTANQYKIVKIADTIEPTQTEYVKVQIALRLATQNIYVKTETGFKHNLPYAAYLLTHGKEDLLYTRIDSKEPVYHSGEVVGPKSYPVAAKSDKDSPVKLFVLVSGGYVEYDPNNLAHCDLPLFYRLTKGFYPIDEATEFFYRPSDGKFYTTQSSSDLAGIVLNGVYESGDIYFTQLDAVDGANKYYYNNINDYTAVVTIPGASGPTLDDIDAPYKYQDSDNRFSQKRVFSIKQENLTNDITGYLTTDINEVQKGKLTLNTAKKDNTNALISYEIIKEKSATLLCSLAASQHSVTEMDAILKSLHLGDLLDIAPGSLFEHLENETLETLSTAIPGLFTNLTIEELISYLNITTIDPGVLSLIGNLTFPKFFASLTLDPTTGAITFNMEELFK